MVNEPELLDFEQLSGILLRISNWYVLTVLCPCLRLGVLELQKVVDGVVEQTESSDQIHKMSVGEFDASALSDLSVKVRIGWSVQ